LTFDYRLSTSQIPQIASRTDFVWGSGWPAQWHAANPKTYVSYYLTWNQDTSGQNLAWWNANHPDWVMYQCDQKTPATVSGYSELILDISNPAVQAWQMAQVKTGASQGYDGIAFDLFALDNHRSACGIFRNGQWVQLYNGTRSDTKYTADVLSWLKNMYSAMHALPKPMGLIPNYTLDRAANDPAIAQVIANVDAVLDEYATGNDGYYTTDDSWLQRMQFIEALQQANKAYFALSGFSTLDSNAVQWALASYLMTKEHHDAIYVAQVSGTTYGSDAWHNEYLAMVGAACGAMTASGGVYVRSFATGVAIVNPSSSASASYTLPAGTYTDLYGKSVTGTVTLAPHSGLVLIVGGAPRC
jgi:hypothetical protein